MRITNIIFTRTFSNDYKNFSLDEQERILQVLVEIREEKEFPPKWIILSPNLIGYYGIIAPCASVDIGLATKLIGSELLIVKAYPLPIDGDFPKDNIDRYLDK